ncbi:hypothetical protein [Actinopolymorpha rutila]|uniref:Uncharacterized protein n=1 Tax=Actinopolymorpha rutila TaxID=446787 RepID=A0A852ZJ18_9ACTN|nr:hypothetical protein [Actinopolymorpha rutila]NYH89569.1 hypothetical protein [Actinopolymorpha rutila]
MPARFNAPPNWPVPSGWTPPPHWKPDPAWGPPPYGWQVWVEESPSRSACRRRHVLVAFGVVAGLGSMLGYVQAFSAPEPAPATFTTNTEDAGKPAAERPAPTSREGAGPAAPGTEVDVSRQDPVPYSVSPPNVDTPPPTRKPRTPASPGEGSGRPGAPAASPRETPPDAANGQRAPSPGRSPSRVPGPGALPGHETNGYPHRLGGGLGPWSRHHSDHSHQRPRFEQPVEALRRTRSASPTTAGPATAGPATPTPAPTRPSAPGSAAGRPDRGRSS